MSGKGKSAFAAAVFLLITLNSSWLESTYEYEVTVGPGGSYDFNTINAAIVDIDNNRPAGESFAQGGATEIHQQRYHKGDCQPMHPVTATHGT
jgi:hypothetical protein